MYTFVGRIHFVSAYIHFVKVRKGYEVMQYTDIGIDLGTASILVYIRGRGVVLKEPSVVAFDRDTEKIKAIGEDARLMLGRTPGNIVAVRPLRQGVISDYKVTEQMMKYFIQKAIGKKDFQKTAHCRMRAQRRHGGGEEGCGRRHLPGRGPGRGHH